MTGGLADLLADEAIERLVGPVEYRAGRALADSGGVRLRDVEAERVTADVDLEPATERTGLEVERAHESAAAASNGTAHVELRSPGQRLESSCDCPTGRRRMPCAHVAAAAIEANRRGMR